MSNEKINYDYWQRVIIGALIGMSICLFIVEIIVNSVLFFTGSQGYNSETIVGKLIRYQLITTVFDISVVVICSNLCKKIANNDIKKYILTVSMVLICFNTAFSHYQFSPAFLCFIIPMMFTIMYEDVKMSRIITGVVIATLIGPIIARGVDSEYGANIVPEAIISISLLLLLSYFCGLIISVMTKRRNELNEALIKAEQLKYLDELNRKNGELEELSRETFEAIAKSIDANDPYTAGHSRRVAEYSKMIATKLGYNDEDIEEVYYAGLIHDVGKIGIDNDIINKTERLNDEEYKEIKKHPGSGYNILKGISVKGKFAYGAKYHHERMDGKGYPEGLQGEDIPVIARIIAVADAYDAMTSARSYRGIMDQSKVREQIEKGKNIQFDPKFADIMLSLIDEDTEYKMKQQLD